MLKKFYPTTVKGKFMFMILIAFVAIIGLGLFINYKQSYKGIIDSEDDTTKEIMETSGVIDQVNEIIAHSSSSASKIAGDIGGISKISMDMSHNAKKISEKSNGLTGMAEDANTLVSKFKV